MWKEGRRTNKKQIKSQTQCLYNRNKIQSFTVNWISAIFSTFFKFCFYLQLHTESSNHIFDIASSIKYFLSVHQVPFSRLNEFMYKVLLALRFIKCRYFLIHFHQISRSRLAFPLGAAACMHARVCRWVYVCNQQRAYVCEWVFMLW